MNYLLDTNVLSSLLLPKNPIKEWLASLDSFEVSCITLMEIRYGFERKPSKDKQAKYSLLRHNLNVHPVSEAIADLAGIFLAKSISKGLNIGYADCLIASTASHCGFTLATFNIKDFQHLGIALLNPSRVY